MSQPVKLSDSLVLDARLTSQAAERSIAGQIEFWARLGRAVEPLLSGEQALALRQSGDAQPLSKLLASVEAPEGRRRVAEYLASQPFPHYELAQGEQGEQGDSASGGGGLVMRIEEDGRRTVGKFVRGVFHSASALKKLRARSTPRKAPKTTKKRTRS